MTRAATATFRPQRTAVVRLPSSCLEQTAIELQRTGTAGDYVIDARRLDTFDAVTAATLGMWRLEAESSGHRLELIQPLDPKVRRQLRGALGFGPSRSFLLPARGVRSNTCAAEMAEEVCARLEGRVPNAIATAATAAAATLADNAATHAVGAYPVTAAEITLSRITICVRDLGVSVSNREDARMELRKRIQLPAQTNSAPPGAPAGIAWVAYLIETHNLDAELVFASGSGRLRFSNTGWHCQRGPVIDGFVAISTFVLK